MGLFTKVKFALNPSGVVGDLIKNWKPRRCQTEKDYENSLYQYLHGQLDDVQITKQFAQGRIRADLMVGDKVIIELKHNFDSTSKYQRLIGQLDGYKDWKGPVIIVLTGDVDPNLRKELVAWTRKHDDPFFGLEFMLIEK